MISYPVSFKAIATAGSGIQAPWVIESAGQSLACAIPVEFEGSGSGLSPEDLFAQALTNCFLATLKVYAEKSHTSFERIEANTELIVDLGDFNQPLMKFAHMNVSVFGATRPERLKTLAEKALRSGFILNSVKTEIVLNLSFEDATQP